MSEWRRVTKDSPGIGEYVWVAYHGHGEVQVHPCTRIKNTGYWGDWDYINSHDGEPQWWAPHPPVPPGLPALETFIHADCGCDGCTEQFAEEEPRDSCAREIGGKLDAAV